MVHWCGNCGKAEPGLKVCARCSSERYCSRDCQKAHWKTHKKACGVNVTATCTSESSRTSPFPSTATSFKNLATAITHPFHKLEARIWLHDRPEDDVYKLLIDTFRLRINDDYKFSAIKTKGSIYAGRSDSLSAFYRYLHLAESRQGLLPPWWSSENSAACVALSMNDPEGWYSLRFGPEKGDINEHYGDSKMAMQMRMLGEQIYGNGPGGQDSTAMRQMMMAQERGGLISSMLSIS